MVACHMCISKIKQNYCPYSNCVIQYIVHANNNDDDTSSDDDDDDDMLKRKKRKLIMSNKKKPPQKSTCRKICFTRFAKVICLPCRHLCICLTCLRMQDNNVHQCSKC